VGAEPARTLSDICERKLFVKALRAIRISSQLAPARLSSPLLLTLAVTSNASAHRAGVKSIVH